MGAVIVLVVVAGLVSVLGVVVARIGAARAGGITPRPGPPAAGAVPPRAGRRHGTTRPPRAASGRVRPRPRKQVRPAGRAAAPGGARRGWGPLTPLSAVENRGRLARLDAVTFVEPTPAPSAPAPALADATAAPAGRADQAVATSEPSVAYDALPPEATRRLQAPCQIVRVERVGPGTVIDLVTLGRCTVAGEAVPSGTPLALGFGAAPPGASCQDLDAVMGYWEAIGAVVDLEVVVSVRATHYRFACRDDGLALLVQAERA